MAWTGGLLVALGLGAALVGGAGAAHAESPGSGSSPGHAGAATSVAHSRPAAMRASTKPPRPSPPTPSDPAPEPVAVAASALARRDPETAVAGPAPRPVVATPTVPAFVSAVTTYFDELHDYLTGASEAQPSPGDATSTPFGEIGKWMLGRNGKLAGWPSTAYPFKHLYQPINVIIVDPTSTTAAESAAKLNAALTAAGFPAQPIHSTGYQGVIDGVVYGQQPTGTEEAFSNANWLLPNDHGRVFGAAPNADGTGFVWTASFSREQPGFYYLTPTHIYVSYNDARDAVADALVAGGALSLGEVDMDNALDGRTTTTGDADGYAVVIQLS